MIRNVAELLGNLLGLERRKLDAFALTHGPTIGRMYEGLTADILDRAIPPQFNLRVVSGFIFNDAGQLTGEIDCMLVAGEGCPIPYTNSFKWHIREVLAILEVKKRLYSAELEDSFGHLRGVLDSYIQHTYHGDPNEPVSVPHVRRAFAEITRIVAPPLSEIESLPLQERMILHALLLEHASPIRAVLGHHGFRSEFSFRESMLELIRKNEGVKGFGVGAFPQLIVSGAYSLLKVNGVPYSAPMRGGYWDFYVSCSETPLLLLLELIWTRLGQRFEVRMPWGEDLALEMFHPFLSARAFVKNSILGWEYHYTAFTHEELTAPRSGPAQWEPVFLSYPEFVEINRLCGGAVVDVHDADLVSFLDTHGLSVATFLDSLLKTGLVAMNGSKIELMTEHCECVILPTGDLVAAENNTGRLTRWVLSEAWRNG